MTRLIKLTPLLILLAATCALAQQTATPKPPRTQVVLLGTGTPPADPDRSGAATAVVVNGTAYLVDFGAGVVRRAKSAVVDRGVAALDPVKLRVVFVTHLHSDHTVGYPDLDPDAVGVGAARAARGVRAARHQGDDRARARGVQRGLCGAHAGSRVVHGGRVSRRPCRERARDRAGRDLQGRERDGDGVRHQTRHGEFRVSLRCARSQHRDFGRHQPDPGDHRRLQRVRRADPRSVDARLAGQASGLPRLCRAPSHHHLAARRTREQGAAETAGAVSRLDFPTARGRLGAIQPRRSSLPRWRATRAWWWWGAISTSTDGAEMCVAGAFRHTNQGFGIGLA